MSEKIKRLGLTLLIFLGFSYLYTHKLILATSFEGDLARDAFDILKIAKGDLTLLGPKLSFGGIYSSPFYYYLFTPILFLARFNFEVVIYANAIMFALVHATTFYFLSHKLKIFRALLLILCLGLSPIGIFLARHPGNAFTIMIFLELLLLTLVLTPKFKTATLLITGFLSGLIVSLHPVTLLIVLPLVVLIWTRTSRKQQIIFYILAALIPFLPLILFEIKHNFIMLTNTFVHKSYKMFVNNQNLGGPLQVSSNPFINFFLLNTKMASFSILSPIVLIITSGIFANKGKNKTQFIVLTLVSLVLLSFFLRHQFARHYLYPFVCLSIFLSAYLIARSRFFWILFIYLGLIFINFPRYEYSASGRQIIDFKITVENLINSKFITPSNDLNLIMLRQGVATTPYGFEYRYFMLQNNIQTLNEYKYNISRNLLIIEEYPQKPQQIYNWEIDQFGKDNWKKVKKTTSNNRIVYLISK